MAKRSSTGGIGGTALGLLALGFSSAVFGALVVGPKLGGPAMKTDVKPERSARAEKRYAREDEDRSPAPVSRSRRSEASDVQTREEPHAAPAAEPQAEPQAQPVETAPAVKSESKWIAPTQTEIARSPGETRSSRPEVERPEPVRRTEPAPEPRTRRSERTEKAPAARVEPERKPDPAVTRKPESAEVGKKTEPTPGPAAAEEETSAVYRVRVGRYKTREEADKVRDELNKAAGSAASVFKVGDTYRVQVGAYRRKGNAEKIAQELRARSYSTEVDETKRKPE